jgi:hypothetical protein
MWVLIPDETTASVFQIDFITHELDFHVSPGKVCLFMGQDHEDAEQAGMFHTEYNDK